MIGPVAIAHDAWKGDPPDWVIALARACAETSQNKVALRLGRSAALVSNVLRNKHGAETGQIEEVVRGA